MQIAIFVGTQPELVKAVGISYIAQAVGHNVNVYTTSQIDDYSLATAQLFEFQTLACTAHAWGKDFKLNIENCVKAVASTIESTRPDFTLTIGDTATALAATIASKLSETPTIHFEAGMRSGNKASPWPEEEFRTEIDFRADVLVATNPDDLSRIRNGDLHSKPNALVTNSGFYALAEHAKTMPRNPAVKPQCLLFLHRRELSVDQYGAILSCLAETLSSNTDHSLRVIAHRRFGGFDYARFRYPRLTVSPPLDFSGFQELLRSSELIISDSGTLQEECFAYAKRLIVPRLATERTWYLNECRMQSLCAPDPEPVVDLCVQAIEQAVVSSEQTYPLRSVLTLSKRFEYEAAEFFSSAIFQGFRQPQASLDALLSRNTCGALQSSP